ncbi:MAG: hypothetical protein WBA89_15020 [Microcoleus sp.]|uniref:hypothetical protein n=1 Tax=Microcoleus sp. TaxID=44472 RepID=UPI003C739742
MKELVGVSLPSPTCQKRTPAPDVRVRADPKILEPCSTSQIHGAASQFSNLQGPNLKSTQLRVWLESLNGEM